MVVLVGSSRFSASDLLKNLLFSVFLERPLTLQEELNAAHEQEAHQDGYLD